MPDAIVLTIAGFDPSSGAGITADLKTISAHGCYGVACITALTVQSTQGVKAVHAVSADLLRASLEELHRDLAILSVKVGMLATAEISRTVGEFLVQVQPPVVVIDPVLVSSSGAPLLDPAGFDILRECLIPLATVITPNLSEALALSGAPDLESAGRTLLELGARAAVITNGDSDAPVDCLFTPASPPQRFFGERILTTSTHGTGCAFSTALTCQLARGIPLPDAVAHAKRYVTEALRQARPLGKGIGPIEHFWNCSTGK